MRIFKSIETPLMREINPSVSENIAKTAERINEAVKVFDETISQKGNEAIIGKTDELVEVDIKKAFQNEYVLFNILSPYGFSSAQIEQIYHSDLSKIGNQWCSMNHVVTIDRTRLFIDKKIEERQPMRIPEEGLYVFSEKERVSVKLQVADENFQVNRNSSYACLDADKVQFPLYLRRATIGDRFVPFGMKGSKLVSDFLTDRKKTRHEKAKQLVVTDKTGNIVWLVNERPDNRFCITDDTRNVLILCLLP
jgi:tRNA(Ile)-lysidine synthase